MRKVINKQLYLVYELVNVISYITPMKERRSLAWTMHSSNATWI